MSGAGALTAEDFRGRVFLSWAGREMVMRQQAASVEPLHVQFAGEGMIVVQPDGLETVFHAPLQQLDSAQGIVD